MESDPATSPQASYEPDVADKLDTELDLLRELCALPDYKAAGALAEWLEARCPRNEAFKIAADMFRLFLCRMLFARRPRHEAWLWAIAVGMECAEGRDMSEVGDLLGVSKQAISKQVKSRCEKFGLPRSRYVNSAQAKRDRTIAKQDLAGLKSVREQLREALVQ